MYVDVVEGTETVLKTPEMVLAARQGLRTCRIDEKALKEIDRIAQFFDRNSKIVTIANIQLAHLLQSLFHLLGPAIEQMNGIWPGFWIAANGQLFQPTPIFDPLQGVENKKAISGT